MSVVGVPVGPYIVTLKPCSKLAPVSVTSTGPGLRVADGGDTVEIVGVPGTIFRTVNGNGLDWISFRFFARTEYVPSAESTTETWSRVLLETSMEDAGISTAC